jgi:hypothetical protein
MKTEFNPVEIPFTTHEYELNVTKIFEDINKVLDKPSLKNKHVMINLKRNIQELYTLFLDKKGITSSYSHFNVNRFSIIDDTADEWHTWYAIHLISLPIARLKIILENDYKHATNKEKFVSDIDFYVVRFLSNIEVEFFKTKIVEISIWVNSKNHSENANEIKESFKFFMSLKFIKSHFKKLVDHKLMSQKDVEHLIASNFDSESKLKPKKFDIKLDKSHLNFFIHSFFKNYLINEKNIALKTSTFLINNFKMYQEEAIDSKKEAYNRKNLRSIEPKKYFLH